MGVPLINESHQAPDKTRPPFWWFAGGRWAKITCFRLSAGFADPINVLLTVFAKQLLTTF